MNGRKANKEDKRRRQWRKQNACLTFHQIENKKKSFLIHFFCSQKRVCKENWFSKKKKLFCEERRRNLSFHYDLESRQITIVASSSVSVFSAR